jgi:hypothetical protein
MVRDVDRGDGRLPGLDAFDEVALVIVRPVELHRVIIGRDLGNQSMLKAS